MFGKLMSISDTLMWRYFELLSFRPLDAIAGAATRNRQGRNPRDVKFELATELVARFHDSAAAERAKAEFLARHVQKTLPTDLPLTRVATQEADIALGAALVAAQLGEQRLGGQAQDCGRRGAYRWGEDQ